MVKLPSSKISSPLPFNAQCCLESPASLNARFPSFANPIFYLKLYKISPNPTPVVILWLVS